MEKADSRNYSALEGITAYIWLDTRSQSFLRFWMGFDIRGKLDQGASCDTDVASYWSSVPSRSFFSSVLFEHVRVYSAFVTISELSARTNYSRSSGPQITGFLIRVYSSIYWCSYIHIYSSRPAWKNTEYVRRRGVSVCHTSKLVIRRAISKKFINNLQNITSVTRSKFFLGPSLLKNQV